VDFTREPIIETIITPRDGCKIVVRSSKTIGQEEHFVDAVEVISFGQTTFFRSQERPKAFLVPASDYEVLEVREARVVLKNVGLDRSIKIAGGKESAGKESGGRSSSREEKAPKEEREKESAEGSKEPQARKGQEAKSTEAKPAEARPEGKHTRSGRRRGRGRRRGEMEEGSVQETEGSDETSATSRIAEEAESEKPNQALLSSLLTPPPVLISETLHRYRDNALFQSAFYTKEELAELETEAPAPAAPEIGSYETPFTAGEGALATPETPVHAEEPAAEQKTDNIDADKT
jgi:hypothetical protein